MATQEEQAVVIKKIIILMPFEGEDTTKNQLFKLIYQRLKHIIEKRINNDAKNPVTSRNKRCKFTVNVFLATTGDNIKDDALRTIRDCDIAIGFVCDTNVTVVYELAVRNLLRAELILILDGEETLLPFYLRKYAYIIPTYPWSKDEFLIRQAGKESPQAVTNFNDGDTPDLLKAYSDENDRDIQNGIRSCAAESGQLAVRPPAFDRQRDARPGSGANGFESRVLLSGICDEVRVATSEKGQEG